MSGLGLKNEGIISLDPENNALETNAGHRYTYDWLVAAPGVVLRFDKI